MLTSGRHQGQEHYATLAAEHAQKIWRQNGFGGIGLAIVVGSVGDDGSGVGCNDDMFFYNCKPTTTDMTPQMGNYASR